MGSIMIMPEENVSPFHLSSRAAVLPPPSQCHRSRAGATPPICRRYAAAMPPPSPRLAAAATEAEQGNLGEAVGGR